MNRSYISALYIPCAGHLSLVMIKNDTAPISLYSSQSSNVPSVYWDNVLTLGTTVPFSDIIYNPEVPDGYSLGEWKEMLSKYLSYYI